MASTALKLPAVPLLTVISEISKPVAASLNVAVTVNNPFTVVAEVELNATVGAVLSKVTLLLLVVAVTAVPALPAASMTPVKSILIPCNPSVSALVRV